MTKFSIIIPTYNLGLSVIAASLSVIFPEAGIPIERATFTIVLALAYVKMHELLTPPLNN